jgi:hypothetical protein
MQLSDFIIAQIRTWVPAIVGAALTWLASFGLDLWTVEAEWVSALTALFIGVYYLLVRVLAEKWGWFGYLLGYNKAPSYSDPA